MVRRPKFTGITNAILLQHLQGMRYSLDRLETRVGGVETRIGGLEQTMKVGFAKVHVRLDSVEKDVHDINIALQRLYTRRVEMLGCIERLEETVGIAA